MKKPLSTLLCVLLALSSMIGTASGSSFLQNPDAIEEAIKSVLFIAIFDENDEITATGSGFVAFNNRTIVTNHHVIEDADSIWASDEADNIYEIDRILAMDEEKDIAILSIKSATSLTPLKLADNPTLKRGQPILTIGSPEGLKNSVSNGIISALYDRNDTPDIQFTAPISHGSSGGALFNDSGEVIGVTSNIYEEGQNLNFAIGIYHVIDLYRQYNPSYVANNPTATSAAFKPTPKPSPIPEMPAPENLKANTVGNTVTLTWSTVEGAASYRVYRATSINGMYNLVKEITDTIYRDSDLLAGAIYFYKVSCRDGLDHKSELSDSVETVIPRATSSPKPTLTPGLPAPENLEASIAENGVTLTWSAVESAASYRIYRATSASGMYNLVKEITETTYYDTELLMGTTYFFKVSCRDGLSSKSDLSNYVVVVIPKPTPSPTPSPTPAPVSFISQEEVAKYKTLTIGTNDPDVAKLKKRMYELGYSISKTANNSFTEKTAEYVGEFQKVNGLLVDGVASPLLQALLFSDHAIPEPTPIPKPSPTPKPTPRLSKPANVKAKISGTTISVTWTTVKGATQYKIYRSTQASGYYSLAGTTSTNKYTDTMTLRGYTYYYKVESLTGQNVSERSSYAKAIMPKPTPTPYIEPKYPLVMGDYAYWNERSSYVSFNPKVVNTSEESTIVAFTLTFYCENVYGEKIMYNGTSGYYSEATYSKTVKPGGSAYVGYTDITGYFGIEHIYAAVTKMHTSYGITITVPESDWDFIYWTID